MFWNGFLNCRSQDRLLSGVPLPLHHETSEEGHRCVFHTVRQESQVYCNVPQLRYSLLRHGTRIRCLHEDHFVQRKAKPRIAMESGA